MALREVTVEVRAKYTTKVIACSAAEAREKAKNLILLGVITPDETDETVIDVQEVTK